MSRSLVIRNYQRRISIDGRRMRRITADLLRSLELDEFDLAIYFVSSAEITRLNEIFLQHKGPTDVITFDYAENTFKAPPSKRDQQTAGSTLHGEIFICIDEAVSQAKHFRTTWQSELARYVVHGVLHLLGYNDTAASARRAMKREEDRLVRNLVRRFRLSNPGRAPRLAG